MRKLTRIQTRLQEIYTTQTAFVRHPREPRMWLKLEGSGLLSSHKDRSAAYVVAQHLREGRPVAKVVDRSSGSWAKGLSRAVHLAGGRTRFVCVGTPPPVVEAVVRANAGEFVSVVTNAERRAKVEESVAEGFWCPDQHGNPLVIEAFERTLGPRLLQDIETLPGPMRFLVAPVGTGGLLAGTARCLRRAGLGVEAVGADRSSSLAHEGARTWQPCDFPVRGVGSDDEVCETLRLARTHFEIREGSFVKTAECVTGRTHSRDSAQQGAFSGVHGASLIT